MGLRHRATRGLTKEAHVLCTWDRLHFYVREHAKDAGWDAINPALLGDLLSLASTEQHDTAIASPVVIAKIITEEAATAGAIVWDKLAKIEEGNLHDAELIKEAKRFKDDFTVKLQKGEILANLGKAWAKWKAEQYKRR